MTDRATWPTRRTYSWTSRTAALDPCCSFDATLASAPGQPKLAALQLLDLVAQRCRLLEFEVRRRGLHLRLQPGHVGVELRLRLELARLVGRGRHRDVVALVDAGHHLVDALHDRGRGDPVLLVIGLLDRTPAV